MKPISLPAFPPLSAHTCRVVWIRHGETAWNTEKRFQGHLDIPLNDTGRQQAEKLAVRFRHYATPQTSPTSTEPNRSCGATLNITHLYASDLQRASETARIIGDALGLTLQTDSGLRERNYGELGGLTADEMALHHPEVYRGLSQRTPDAPVPGGESLQVFYQRIIDRTQTLLAAHTGQTVCVVVHGGVLDCIYRHANSIALDEPRRWLLANTSVNVVDHAPDGWRVLHWGDTAHLQAGAEDEVDGRIA